MTMKKLSVQNIEKSFGQTQVLKGISFEADEGDFLSLLGRPAAENPRCCASSAAESPDAGSVFVSGQDITRQKPEKRNIGMVFQNYALFPSMNVAKNVGYGLKMRAWRRMRSTSA